MAYKPPCTTNSDTCRQRRILALETAVGGLQDSLAAAAADVAALTARVAALEAVPEPPPVEPPPVEPPPVEPPPPPTVPPGVITVDDFTSGALDPTLWVTRYPWYDNQHHLNDRYEVNLDSQVTVHDGVLDIRAQAIATDDPRWPGNGDYAAGPDGRYPYRSGVATTGYVERDPTPVRFAWLYGLLEVRAQFPVGAGPYWSTSPAASKLWPAIWCMPASGAGWSATTPEVDIMEAFGDTRNHVGWALHGIDASGTYPAVEYGGGWHTWGWNWQPGRMEFLVDGVVRGTVATAPAVPYYLLLNLAVGMYPGFGPPALPGTPTDAHLLVDSVRLTRHQQTQVWRRGVLVP